MRARAFVAAALSSIILGLVALATSTATAQAAYHIHVTNGFEGNPWATWEGLSEGNANAGADINQGLAFRGQNNGWLHVVSSGWAAERWRIDVSGSERDDCEASIWARTADAGPAPVELQIWDPNGWRLLTKNTPTVQGNNYTQIFTPEIDLSGVSTVYVQAIYGQQNGPERFIRIDEAQLDCY
ncbi:hypothetical protein Lesp02_06500 [Lentzea sp. NBRC 105346]|uniref:hypothetical protein n=1 Tax=Lentzea sp. NBRC 105346 TaxID=3032205 RepID=UPI00249FE45E|nr:hypothetical protein [Lentzea sp. NBRC 105346]GLZ28460.1 hypothetical protein Lesp02_06500 [Lentzea sp. NBRC 105346]